MCRDLLIIPHEWAGLPVFGVGWALAAWLVFAVVLLAYLSRQQGFSNAMREQLPVLVLGSLAIVFLLPVLELTENRAGQAVRVGLPIRGYGFLLLLAALAGVTDATIRARRVGLSAEIIHALAFWMFCAGLAGARLFFVVNEWDQFTSPHWPTLLGNLLNITQGGLVVYGALIGGMLAAVIFCVRHALPILAISDLIAPSMALGLCIGRLGCLMNGCCFGDPCAWPWGVTFPAGSPPYEFQQSQGLGHGLRLRATPEGGVAVAQLLPGGVAEKAGLRVDDVIVEVNGHGLTPRDPNMSAIEQARYWLAPTSESGPAADSMVSVTTSAGKRINWRAPEDGPVRSQPVHPTQLYSALKAGLLFLVLYFFYPFRTRDGQAFACLLTLYPISRFAVEILRGDCGTVGATGLTIAQIVSILLLAGGAALWGYLRIRPGPLAWPTSLAPPTRRTGTAGAGTAS